MKLIRIISNNDSYTVHAASSVKFLGLRLFSKISIYEKQKDSSNWYKVPQSSKVSGQKEKNLISGSQIMKNMFYPQIRDSNAKLFANLPLT